MSCDLKGDMMMKGDLPQQQGLYDPAFEKDSCGVGMVADVAGQATHEIVEMGLEVLQNMKHRGAVGADATTGDGAGAMTQIPHDLLVRELAKEDITLPPAGGYGVGMLFLPRVPAARMYCEGVTERVIRSEGLRLIGWREVPVDVEACGVSARATRPAIVQVFIERGLLDPIQFERKLLIIRKQIQQRIGAAGRPYADHFYICSLSSRTLVYKGQILGYMLSDFYKDLCDPLYRSAFITVHERYSTNTFPSWQLAQPFRYVAHNGEINTIRGNINRMNAREGVMQSGIFGKDFKKLLPVIEGGGSDSACFDNALELYVAGGHDLAYMLMLMIPEAWQNDKDMPEDIRAFYEYHARTMEPWDGPAAMVCSDGRKIVAKLDRNGLRPARYARTEKGRMIIASEVGVVALKNDRFVEKGALEPGKLLVIDLEQQRIIPDEEVKSTVATSAPFQTWVNRNRLELGDVAGNHEIKRSRRETRPIKQAVFGYTEAEIKRSLLHMAKLGKEPIGSMGIDTPIAVLSERPKLLFSYFRQGFAQVTNPPIDPIRERMVVSLRQFIGRKGIQLDEIETSKDGKYIVLRNPVVSSPELEDLRHMYNDDFRAVTLPAVFEADAEDGLEHALDNLCRRAEESVRDGYNLLVISDRNMDKYNGPIPSLLALGAVHQHLIRKKLRTSVDLLVEAGDVRDVMHVALLIGYGAKAVNPYLAYEIIVDSDYGIEGFAQYKKAIGDGLLKIISRMGISTLQCYNAAQIFEIVGLSDTVTAYCFTDTPSRIGGLDFNRIATDVTSRLRHAYRHPSMEKGILPTKDRMFSPNQVRSLREASQMGNAQAYATYSQQAADQRITIRDWMTFKETTPIAIEKVEAVEQIVKRFTVPGISFGSISQEAHETFAVAMNRLGGTSNSGEGGEDPERSVFKSDGTNACSMVKQVASARFGVTTSYLINSTEIQIKIAQGAKPGEGGHLPGEKVTEQIAKTRHAQPGSDLISPPPHHDIYSIEDLAQLIFDLKNVNPSARIGVKLVSGQGIGTVAAGVAKAHADVIQISGYDGGTGASPVSSMKYVGLPWEMGLAEAQQTLMLNGLRGRVRLQVDGKLRTGRDVVIAALLGAEEYGFGTAAMIAIGCTMCRQCHKGTCNAGIATQSEKRRRQFSGKPEYVENFMRHVAGEVRQLLAELGLTSLDEAVGRVDLLRMRSTVHEKVAACNWAPLLYQPALPSYVASRKMEEQPHEIKTVLDMQLLESIRPQKLQAKAVGAAAAPIPLQARICNTDRSTGAMLSGALLRAGVQTPVHVLLEGTAGQSFGAFVTKQVQLTLHGDANDYVGKGLSGGRLIIRPESYGSTESHLPVIAGNTALYGATSGELYIAGKAGQRFAVRNSGARAVVEGVGNHGCEYMTGGQVLVLGELGTNFGAGMTGGLAYVLGKSESVRSRCNLDLVDVVPAQKEDMTAIRGLIEEHYTYTNSPSAQEWLENWTDATGSFSVVRPR